MTLRGARLHHVARTARQQQPVARALAALLKNPHILQYPPRSLGTGTTEMHFQRNPTALLHARQPTVHGGACGAAPEAFVAASLAPCVAACSASIR